MRKLKKFDYFISENIAPAEPEIDIKPARPKTIEEPAPPALIPGETEEPAPAKAVLPTAKAEDVVRVFANLLRKSGEDIKKYSK